VSPIRSRLRVFALRLVATTLAAAPVLGVAAAWAHDDIEFSKSESGLLSIALSLVRAIPEERELERSDARAFYEAIQLLPASAREHAFLWPPLRGAPGLARDRFLVLLSATEWLRKLGDTDETSLDIALGLGRANDESVAKAYLSARSQVGKRDLGPLVTKLAFDERPLLRYIGGLIAYDSVVLGDDTRPHLSIIERTIADRDPVVADRFIQRVGPNLRDSSLLKRLAARLSDRRHCAGRATGLLRGGEHEVRESVAWVLDWVYADVHRTPGALVRGGRPVEEIREWIDGIPAGGQVGLSEDLWKSIFDTTVSARVGEVVALESVGLEVRVCLVSYSSGFYRGAPVFSATVEIAVGDEENGVRLIVGAKEAALGYEPAAGRVSGAGSSNGLHASVAFGTPDRDRVLFRVRGWEPVEHPSIEK
jgi:hypothetical protein